MPEYITVTGWRRQLNTLAVFRQQIYHCDNPALPHAQGFSFTHSAFMSALAYGKDHRFLLLIIHVFIYLCVCVFRIRTGNKNCQHAMAANIDQKIKFTNSHRELSRDTSIL